ncbi:MAG TPA: hypothetical protein PKE30_19340 [Niabella sp.]|nr:hypothetical protein [Niabella sp.]
MNRFSNTLSDTVLARPLDHYSPEELQNLAQKHPYASAIQLLYAQKLRQTGNEAYAAQAQKTFLYYNNPLFIQHLIETDSRPASIKTMQAEAETVPAEEQHLTPAAITETAEIKEIPAHPPVAVENIAEEETSAGEVPLPPLPVFKIEAVDPGKAELSFTPYYTVDYFAAQGIKWNDQNVNDRFGVQLKSFTSWLKQMKRLPGATTKTNITLNEEKSIEQMAQRSITGENADTEAMAEVWAKQGDIQKAIALYKKLSLQIPGKSAYFAAKIDHLKK